MRGASFIIKKGNGEVGKKGEDEKRLNFRLGFRRFSGLDGKFARQQSCLKGFTG
jgi:hypothetical protein